jgi:hypothetical protein
MQLINFESRKLGMTTAKNFEEEKELIEAKFEYVRYSDRYEVVI